MINLFELVLMGILGLLFLVLGLRIWKREEITFIHSYHYKKVAEKDKNQYTEEMCKSIVLMGIGMALTGIIDFITNTVYGWLFFTVFLY